ncbi:MAG: YIP1 family protein [Candidatus Atribacteria bacterium]|nr:YIP1 family protein [Candidatus Atribacteria bacterium]
MFIETILKIIKSPRKAFKENIPTLSVVLYIILSGVILFLYISAFIKFTLPIIENSLPEIFNTFDTTFIKSAYSVKFLFLCIVYPFIGLLISGAIFELLTQLFYKKSNGIKLLKNLAFSSVPLTIYRLLYVIFALLNFQAFMETGILFTVWNLMLYIFAISETYEIESNKASLIFFFPLILLSLFLILAII